MMKDILKNYNTKIDTDLVDKRVRDITTNITALYDVENLKIIFSCIDLTTLNTEDSTEKGELFADNVSNFKSKFPDMPNVAAICVYPTLVSSVKNKLTAAGVNIASVVGGFPSSQTFLDIKVAETKKAIELGANEADMVISVGTFLSGDYQTIFNEVKELKKAVGDAHLKVILETGALKNFSNIKIASAISIEAGADFIKTSTGKLDPPATLNAVYVMCEAIKEYYDRTGIKIGLKPAGGISTADTALKYYAIVNEVLGKEWLNSKLFRIGASSLANNILTTIKRMTTEQHLGVKYF